MATNQTTALAQATRPRRWRALTLALGLAFLVLAVAAHRGPLPGDAALADALRSRDAGLLGVGYGVLNRLGELPVWDGLVLAGAALLWWLRRRRVAVLLASGLGVELLTAVSKRLVDRPRPAAEGFLGTASFPSGHLARVSVILMLLLALVVWRWPRWRLPAVLLTLALLGCWGAARVASGAHWPSDILGGCLLGTCWAALLLRSDH